MAKTRKAMIDLMNSLVGLNEKDGSFKVIIDTYNKLRPAGSYKMKYKMMRLWLNRAILLCMIGAIVAKATAQDGLTMWGLLLIQTAPQ